MEKKVQPLKDKLIPIILTILVIVLDQVSKALIVKYIPQNTIGSVFFDGFFRIIHVRNTGVAFSVGATWGQTMRNIMFSLIPIIVIALVLVIYFRNNDFTKVQRWAITGIVGGGIGNIIDRIFRSAGVVDFLDVQWFGIEDSPIGLFRMTRWPTFNVADSAVVICGIMLIISFIVMSIKDKKAQQKKNEKVEDSENLNDVQ
ncbi:MAG: signal peptidase II [Treponema sp.]|nr:signal peptidase II [Treponema sp.]